MDYPEKEEAIKEEQRFELAENGHSEKVKEGTTKFVKPKTEVHRTQYIFGLKGQKAAAEKRRFDVNKIIHNHPKSILPSFDEDEDNRQYSSESRSDEETNRGLILNRSTEERDPSSAESLYKDEYETSSSRYSQRSKSSVEEMLREEGSRRRYDSDIVEEYSSAEESSQSLKKNIADDDERRYCCCQGGWSLNALGVAFLVMIIAGTFVLFTGALGSDNDISYMPSTIPTVTYSMEPSHIPSSWPSLAPSQQPTNRPSFIPTMSPSEWPSIVPSSAPSILPTSNKPSYSPTESNQWFEVRTRLNGTKDSGYYGLSVSLSKDGNTLALAHYEDNEVQVYDNVNNLWVMRGVPLIVPYNSTSGFRAAMEVILSASGNVLAIGGRDYNKGRGIVRVFQWDGVSWVQMGQSLFGTQNHKNFGTGVKLSASGMDMAVGARMTKSEVYHFDGANWVQKGSSHIEWDGTGFAWNQDSIAITDDGEYYAVSAMLHEFALVFKWDGSDWVQFGRTLEPEAKNKDKFGSGIDLVKLPSGNLILAIVMTKNEGEIRIYDYDLANNNTDWVERSQRVTSPGSIIFGYSMELSDDGNSIVACTYKDVIMFDWDGSEWVQRGVVMETFTPYDENLLYGIDFWLGMSGDSSTVAVGMPYDNDKYANGANRGQVRTYSMKK